jgi:hypothetical protein
MMKTFSSFLDRKDRENKEHLHILHQILQQAGFQISNYLDENDEPYIFVHKPVDAEPIVESLSFGGVRIYNRGQDLVCYRAQMKETTEPFGTTYMLDVKGMFKDLINESSKERVGLRIIFNIIKEIKDFFILSAKAEREENGGNDSKMGTGMLPTDGAGDYANKVMGSVGTNYGGAAG